MGTSKNPCRILRNFFVDESDWDPLEGQQPRGDLDLFRIRFRRFGIRIMDDYFDGSRDDPTG